MSFVSVLVIIVVIALVAVVTSYFGPSSPVWDAVLVYGLYVLGTAAAVLGTVWAIGTSSGLL